ncbi:MAG: hypothetical protein HY340_02420 [Candidatus Kerfeldbacteria bacterium]|nr:hypothetical protein [Candidatus Kerfeldbacteria bacterium]
MLAYIVSIVTALLYLWLSYLAFHKRHRSKAIRRFGLLLFLSALWVVNSAFQVLFQEFRIGDVGVANLLAKLDFALAAFIAFSVAIFALHFPRTNTNLTSSKEILLFLPSLLLGFLSFVNFFFSRSKVFSSPGQYYPTYWAYLAILIVYFLFIGLGSMIIQLRRVSGVEKLQLKYLTLSYGISIILLLLLSVINAVREVPAKTDLWLSNAAFIFVATAAYSVLKHRLFGLAFIIKKAAIEAVSFVIILLVYSFLILWAEGVVGDAFPNNNSLQFLWVVLILLTYPFLRKIVRYAAKTALLPSERYYREKRIERVAKFSAQFDYDSLFAAFEKEATSHLMVKGINGYLLQKNGDYSPVYPKTIQTERFNKNHSIFELLERGEGVLIRAEIPFLSEESYNEKQRDAYRRADELLQKIGAEVFVVIGAGGLFPIVVTLPPRKEIYRTEEIDLVKKLAREITPAFQNVFLYKQALRRVGVEV